MVMNATDKIDACDGNIWYEITTEIIEKAADSIATSFRLAFVGFSIDSRTILIVDLVAFIVLLS